MASKLLPYQLYPQLLPERDPDVEVEHEVEKVVLVVAGKDFIEQAKDLESFYARHGITDVEIYTALMSTIIQT